MNIRWKTQILLALACMLMLAGCLSPVLVAPSSAPLEGRSYVTTGKTTGEACMSNILGIPVSTDASLKTAMKKAMDMASAQALIDIVVDNRYLYTLFFNRSCTVVHATGIRFTNQPAPYLPPAPAVPPIPPTPGVTPPPAPPAPPAPPEVAPPPAPPVKEKKMTRAEKKRKPAGKRKAEPVRQKAQARKQAPKKNPIPDQYKTFCQYSPGDRIRVETKSQVLEVEFVKCLHSGIQVKAKGKASRVVPFGKVWMVKLLSGAKPQVKPVAPLTPDTSRPAQPRAPAQPRQPAVPR